MDANTPVKPKDKPKVTIPKEEKKKETEQTDTSILGWGLAKKAADEIVKRKAEQKKLLDSI